jgi:hypothetical protein
MNEVRITRRRRAVEDPSPIPSWLDNPEEIGPCPCGNPPDDACMLIEGDAPLSRWFHMGCLDFLEKEMDEEEIEEKRAWEHHVKRMQEGEDDDE